jgi:hypothetical protein
MTHTESNKKPAHGFSRGKNPTTHDTNNDQ